METTHPLSSSPFTQDNTFELFEIDDLEDGNNDIDNVLVKIQTDPTQNSFLVHHENKYLKLIKRICLFQVFGYKGTLIHVVAFYLFLLGVVSAVIGVSMDITVEKLQDLRLWLCSLVENSFYKVIIWVIYTIVLVTMAFLWTKFISPTANGSGVPEMKVTLLGNRIPNLLTFKTLIAKVIGLVFVLGGGMWAGKEGPFIHISSCIASQLTRLPIFRFLRNSNELFMQMLSTATSCGVSSNFGTAIGGLLFSVEVTATYFSVRNYWFGTFSSVIAAFTFRAIFNTYSHSPSLYSGLLSIDYSFPSLQIKDSLISILLGVICGLFAVLFVMSVSTIFKTRQYLRKYKLGRIPYLYLVIVALFTGVVTAPWYGELSPFGYPTYTTLSQMYTNSSVKPLFGKHYLFALFLLFIARFTITAMSISMPVPVGLFSTNIVVGSVLGRFIGECFSVWGISNNLGPSGMAIIGGACFVGSITQTFSAAVIMIELIDDISILVPMLIATVITICFSRFFTVCVYDKIAIDKKLPYIPDIQYSSNQTAEMVMDTNLVPISEYTNLVDLKEIVDQFQTLPDKILPVVNDLEHSVLLGQVKLSVLRKLLDAQIPEHVANKFLLDYSECPLHLLRHTPLSQIHMLFIAAEIDSAFVTSNGRLIGEINKKCLTEAINKQMKILF
ncbi:chloride channel type CLC, putative [Entamoeba histolytica HM-3:IMSS]|uniref:Chloride channel type CLC, putative n=2 Tax=Entamoeba histolytica TaxID=5759 RepID=M2RW47_ENTHI|nr:chloride channel type CLC, putative [Entamoeba histolytica KU27]EMS17577.1 chloride channel type CLC, putative [Entamoeba histolytica HM-3:IMSS]